MARGWEAGGHPAKIKLSAFPGRGVISTPPPPSGAWPARCSIEGGRARWPRQRAGAEAVRRSAAGQFTQLFMPRDVKAYLVFLDLWSGR